MGRTRTVAKKLSETEIEINHAQVVTVSPEDMEFVLEFKYWTQRSDGYVVRGRRKSGKYHLFYLHREIFRRQGEFIPEDMVVDHINRDKLDNRRENLRLVDKQQSAYNRGRNSKGTTSKFKGVSGSYQEGWKVHITVEGRSLYLGTYLSERIAAGVYNNAARQLHGEYAVLNQLTNDDDDDDEELDD